MVSSDSAAWALHAPSRRRTAGSRRGSAGRRSASGAGMRRARSRTGAGPAAVPASSAAARSSGARAWCRAARAARSSPAPGNPSTTVVPASTVSSACPNRRCARPSAGPSPPARRRPPSGPTTRGACGPDPDQSSVPAAPSSTAHCAAPSTGGPGRRENALVQRLERPGRRVFSTEGLGHQAPELRHRNAAVPGVGDDHADAVVAQRDHVRPYRTRRLVRVGGATAARATRLHRGSGNRPFALAGGTSLITPLPSPPPIRRSPAATTRSIRRSVSLSAMAELAVRFGRPAQCRRILTRPYADVLPA